MFALIVGIPRKHWRDLGAWEQKFYATLALLMLFIACIGAFSVGVTMWRHGWAPELCALSGLLFGALVLLVDQLLIILMNVKGSRLADLAIHVLRIVLIVLIANQIGDGLVKWRYEDALVEVRSAQQREADERARIDLLRATGLDAARARVDKLQEELNILALQAPSAREAELRRQSEDLTTSLIKAEADYAVQTERLLRDMSINEQRERNSRLARDAAIDPNQAARYEAARQWNARIGGAAANALKTMDLQMQSLREQARSAAEALQSEVDRQADDQGKTRASVESQLEAANRDVAAAEKLYEDKLKQARKANEIAFGINGPAEDRALQSLLENNPSLWKNYYGFVVMMLVLKLMPVLIKWRFGRSTCAGQVEQERDHAEIGAIETRLAREAWRRAYEQASSERNPQALELALAIQAMSIERRKLAEEAAISQDRLEYATAQEMKESERVLSMALKISEQESRAKRLNLTKVLKEMLTNAQLKDIGRLGGAA